MKRTSLFNRQLVYAMDESGLNQLDLALELGFESSAPISQRINGLQEWRLNECYRVLHILGKPLEDIHIYFPPKEAQ